MDLMRIHQKLREVQSVIIDEARKEPKDGPPSVSNAVTMMKIDDIDRLLKFFGNWSDLQQREKFR